MYNCTYFYYLLTLFIYIFSHKCSTPCAAPHSYLILLLFFVFTKIVILLLHSFQFFIRLSGDLRWFTFHYFISAELSFVVSDIYWNGFGKKRIIEQSPPPPSPPQQPPTSLAYREHLARDNQCRTSWMHGIDYNKSIMSIYDWQQKDQVCDEHHQQREIPVDVETKTKDLSSYENWIENINKYANTFRGAGSEHLSSTPCPWWCTMACHITKPHRQNARHTPCVRMTHGRANLIDVYNNIMRNEVRPSIGYDAQFYLFIFAQKEYFVYVRRKNK